jgi:DNA topoisomerase-6 subunit B
MGITKQEAKEFANGEVKSDRAVELLPLHIFFHICSTKIPYKTAGKESIASEGELKKYMKYCLSELYRKVSAQIRKELRMKEAASRLNLYKYYIPLVVSAISESIKVDSTKLEQAFTELAEKHVRIEQQAHAPPEEKEDRITSERLEEEVEEEAVEIDGELIKPDKEQIAINAARKKGKLTKPKAKKAPETLQKEEKQVTLDTVIEGKLSKGRKKVDADD